MCERPYLVNGKFFTGCGRCLFCRIQKRTMWTMRMLHHQWKYPDSSFITLTYDNDHLPYRGSDLRGILVKDDLQRFFKRLRSNFVRLDVIHSSVKLSYYACGEYGEKGERPHFHAILFGHKLMESKDFVEGAWSMGRVDVQPVHAESIGYVAGYVAKKLGDFRRDTSRAAPFQLASNGIGIDWLKGNMTKLMYDGCLSFKDKSFAIPRYYREKMYGLANPYHVDGVMERLYTAKALALTDAVLELCPQFGGRTFDQLDEEERKIVGVEMAHRGAVINRDLASNAHIKMLGKIARSKRRGL